MYLYVNVDWLAWVFQCVRAQSRRAWARVCGIVVLKVWSYTCGCIGVGVCGCVGKWKWLSYTTYV